MPEKKETIRRHYFIKERKGVATKKRKRDVALKIEGAEGAKHYMPLLGKLMAFTGCCRLMKVKYR